MLATATAHKHPETVDSFNASEGEDLFAPWMFDSNGAAIQFPGEVVGFRARYWPIGARGPGVLVLDEDERPVLIPRNATPEEFRVLVGYKAGRYKLAAIDRGFQFLERLPLVVESITHAMAERAGYRSAESSSVPSSSVPSFDAMTLLSFVKEANAHTQAVTAAAFEQVKETNARALEQIASLQRDANESQRHTTTQLATVVGPVSGVLTAAGSSGVIKKTLALDAAAAGAPVTVMMAANANDAPSTPTHRNAAGSTAAAAAAEKGGSGAAEAMLSLFAPLIERGAPVAAYGLAQKLGLPDHVARDLAGVAKVTMETAGQMLRATDDAPTEAAATSGAAPTVAAVDLGAHVMRIQLGLSEDDRAWIGSLMSTSPGLIDALKPSVASVTVEEGITAVRTLRAVDAALSTTNERRLFGEMLKPSVLPSVFRVVLVERTADEAIEYLRHHAAAMAAG